MPEPSPVERHLRVLGDALGSGLAGPTVDALCAELASLTGATRAGADVHGVWIELPLNTTVPYRMRWCPPGTYLQGSPPTEVGRTDAEGVETQRRVTLSRGFFMGATMVTEAHHFRDSRYPDHPVEGMDFMSAQLFATSISERYPTLNVRLPTEAEWEYAARADTTTATWLGDLETPDVSSVLDAIAWYAANGGGATHDVAQKLPNPWGLYDMLGHTWEWCLDASDLMFEGEVDDDPDNEHSEPRPYAPGPQTDPLSTEGGSRIIRGGSVHDPARFCRAANRHADWPMSDEVGVRLVAVP